MDRKEGHKIQPFISFMSTFLAALSYAAQSKSDSSHTAPTPASEQHLWAEMSILAIKQYFLKEETDYWIGNLASFQMGDWGIIIAQEQA